MIIRKTGKKIIVDPTNLEEGQRYNASVAYFGGTFDPFHIGHFLVTNELCPIFDEVWVHPHSFTKSKNPADLMYRKNMILLGIETLTNAFLMEYSGVREGDYYLPHFLEERVNGLSFSDIIGDDHINRLISQGIERNLYCFARSDKFCERITHPKIHYMVANTSEINSTEIRRRIKSDSLEDIQLQRPVLKYIIKEKVYPHK
jgi:cytidyltransferase-like protein